VILINHFQLHFHFQLPVADKAWQLFSASFFRVFKWKKKKLECLRLGCFTNIYIINRTLLQILSFCLCAHLSGQLDRVKEHLSRNLSAVHEHCQLTGHSVDSSKTKVLAMESNTFKCRIREAIEIWFQKPAFRDNGFKLANIYDTILAPLRP